MAKNTKKSKDFSKNLLSKIIEPVKRTFSAAMRRMRSFLSRRPHRSFRRTRRRDYKRGLNLPGYVALSVQVARTLWSRKKLFGSLVLFYAGLSFVLVGLSSQVTFTELREVLSDNGDGVVGDEWSQLGQAGLLLASGVVGSFAPELNEAEQIYSGLLILLVWLTTVWLLRTIYAGGEPRLRDGLYNAGSPIVATAIVALYMVLQTVPVLIALLILGSVGLLGGATSLLFWAAAILLITLSLYWLTGSYMALIISTLPGMYPGRAIEAAGDMVVGRRLRILLRLIWLLLTVLVLWLVLVLPSILFADWLAGVWEWSANVPLVPVVLLIVTSVSTVWSSAYIYTLYRKVVDDDEAPA